MSDTRRGVTHTTVLFCLFCAAALIVCPSGDLAAEALGQVAMTASDLLDYLPQAMRTASS